MLAGYSTIPVDELYMFRSGESEVSIYGVNNNVVISPDAVSEEKLRPKGAVRILGSMSQLHLILSAGKFYNAPVEVGSPQLASNANVRDPESIILNARDANDSLAPGHPMRFHVVSAQDMYGYGLAYVNGSKQVVITADEIPFGSSKFVPDSRYMEPSGAHHVMGDWIASKPYVADICTMFVDPRFFVRYDGDFEYKVGEVLGLQTLEIGCQAIRRMIEFNGGAPFPTDVAYAEKLFKKSIGYGFDQLIHKEVSVRMLYRLLSAPLDDACVKLSDLSPGPMRDAELVRRTTHAVINEWLSRILGKDWIPDEYDVDAF